MYHQGISQTNWLEQFVHVFPAINTVVKVLYYCIRHNTIEMAKLARIRVGLKVVSCGLQIEVTTDELHFLKTLIQLLQMAIIPAYAKI
jgi:hypothetical protein